MDAGGARISLMARHFGVDPNTAAVPAADRGRPGSLRRSVGAVRRSALRR